MVLLHFARVTRVFAFSYWGRTKTPATRVNSKKVSYFEQQRIFVSSVFRRVEIILSDIVFAMKIFARVARVARAARVSELAVLETMGIKDWNPGGGGVLD